MKVKVHWIIDGIAEIDASNLADAEATIDQHLNAIIVKNPELTEKLGAKSIQGKAYLPGSQENSSKNNDGTAD
ncbi:hypothetical protein N9P21_01900 [Rhodobacteraceae bacterium]|jgi:hypothetical protein|nr:hypothetical protein [Paracoccaceae bacterium]